MKYTIIKINSRCAENIKTIKDMLSDFTYINDIEFCDGKKTDASKIIKNMGIKINWAPYDGRTTDPLPSEFGVWVSNIRTYKYIIKNRIDRMLVLEDDAILSNNFSNMLRTILNNTPKNFDFISLFSFKGHNKEDENTNIGNAYIHKSLNQYSAFQGMVFSLSGAVKILRLLKTEGIEYTNDCQIFRKSLEGKLEGYSLKNEHKIIEHDISVLSNIECGNHRYM
jgi:GR25 family glycosyltransferase involved in LPS biosynthesis